MSTPETTKRPRIFYGYWIVVATFFCLFIIAGCGNFGFSLFVTSLQADLGWSRGEIMAGYAFFALAMGGVSPLIGRLIDRHGARRVILIGAIAAGAGFALLGRMDSLWQFYAIYVLIGAGIAAMGHVPSTTVVSNWFQKRRGTAIGIMSSGIGAGGLAIAPLVGSYLIPTFGWRDSYLALAVITWAVVIPLALFVIRTKPAEMGLYPDGARGPAPKTEPAAGLSGSAAISPRKALALSAFWLIAISFFTGQFSSGGVTQSQVPYLQDIGFPIATAASTLSLYGLGSLVGKFFFGWLCDRIAPKYARAIGLCLLLASILILMNIRLSSSLPVLWLFAITMGLSAGSWLPTMSMAVSSSFGLAGYGTIYGLVTLAHSAGIAAGPLVAGFINDATGSYHWAFVTLLILCSVAILTILAVRHPKLTPILREA